MGRRVQNGLLLTLALCVVMAFSCNRLPIRAVQAEVVDKPNIVDEGSAADNYVIVLDASNFTEVVAQHAFIVVEFYSPWCAHCIQFAPEYEKAAALLRSHQSPIVLAKIDVHANRDLALQHNLQSIPHLSIFLNQGSTERPYKGPLLADGIVSYLKKQAKPPCPQITASEEGAKVVKDADFLVVGVFPGLDSSDELVQSFISIAAELQSDYEFKYTVDAGFLPAIPACIANIENSKPSVRVYKNFDEGIHVFQNSVDELLLGQADAMKKLLESVSIPHVVWLNYKDPVQIEYITKILSDYPQDAQVFLFADASQEDKLEGMKEAYQQLAKENQGKGLRFIIADTVEGEGAMDYFGVRKEKIPAVVIFRDSDEKTKYMLEQADEASMAAWLQGYFQGEVAEFVKSEPVPESNERPVKVVVRDTMEAMVLQAEKNVLLEFYAPWCGHCKRLAPILEELAEEMQVTHPDVVIAKLDDTANDVVDKRFEVEGYPTMYLRVAASGDVVKFEGAPTKDAILAFIDANIVKDAIAVPEASSPVQDDPKDEL